MNGETGGASWENWLQNIGGKLVDGYVDYKVTWPASAEASKMQLLGQRGYYTEGQSGAVVPIGGMSSGTMLLLGVALVAVLLLKD